MLRTIREHARKALKKLVVQLETRRIPTRTVMARGVPFYQIVRAARRLKCDVIVLATHGRTGLRHVLLGSVAENVLRHASCPVLTVCPRGRRKTEGTPRMR
ncbi:MAG TPA: universal stress protein [Candidatus Methylomirabilis sp.]|nr:universal stress protein [Candidatus Methylomirabilis sp.]